MLLITEITEDVKVLTEANASGGKRYVIEGPFMVSNQLNKNNRMYPYEILERECKRYTKNYIKENRAYGELGHPQGPTINLERVSHMIKSLEPDGDAFIGRAAIMETPYGNIVTNLLKEGASLGVSSRGMGSLQPTREGYSMVQDDYYLATAADIVADPSGPGCFVNGIMEGKQWIFENGIFREAALMNARTQINNAARSKDKSKLEEQILRTFNKFINNVEVDVE